MLKRLLGVTAIITLFAGCTPAQHQFWASWFEKDPVAAKPELDKAIKAEVRQGAAFQKAPSWSNCPQWYDEAMAAGFSPNQWGQLDHIMYRESRCIPTAYNRSGASGLVQIMPMWADDCGVTRSMLFNGSVNMRCARHILQVQGWSAWATTRG